MHLEVEIDDNNRPHVTRHGVAESEILEAFDAATNMCRNKKGGSADYFIMARGLRVNFRYDPSTGVARPISAWRLRR